MDINKSTKSFVFKCQEVYKQDVKTYYPDISTIGKHYTFVSLGQDGKTPVREHKFRVLRRHYTIANCMRKDFYESLCKAIKSKSKDDFDMKLIQGEDSDMVTVGIKTYNLTKGLSWRFFNDVT